MNTKTETVTPESGDQNASASKYGRSHNHVYLYLKLHKADGKQVLDLCNKYGLEPREFVKIAVMRYADNLLSGREAQPGRALCELTHKMR
ncbi:MAG: hypothetical protein ACYC39_09480 [Thiobacillus sp.]|nr:MAG: hypothetical protein B7X82_14550 [Hydrogenophilales bacterium 17-64-65]